MAGRFTSLFVWVANVLLLPLSALSHLHRIHETLPISWLQRLTSMRNWCAWQRDPNRPSGSVKSRSEAADAPAGTPRWLSPGEPPAGGPKQNMTVGRCTLSRRVASGTNDSIWFVCYSEDGQEGNPASSPRTLSYHKIWVCRKKHIICPKSRTGGEATGSIQWERNKKQTVGIIIWNLSPDLVTPSSVGSGNDQRNLPSRVIWPCEWSSL